MEDPLPLVVTSVVLKRPGKPDETLIYGEGYLLGEDGRIVSALPLNEGEMLDITYEELVMAESDAGDDEDEDL